MIEGERMEFKRKLKKNMLGLSLKKPSMKEITCRLFPRQKQLLLYLYN